MKESLHFLFAHSAMELANLMHAVEQEELGDDAHADRRCLEHSGAASSKAGLGGIVLRFS